MSYTKVNFTDKTTPLDAANLGILDDALADQDERIGSIENLSGISLKYFSSGESVLDYADDYIANNNVTTAANAIFFSTQTNNDVPYTYSPGMMLTGRNTIVVIVFGYMQSNGIAVNSRTTTDSWYGWKTFTAA